MIVPIMGSPLVPDPIGRVLFGKTRRGVLSLLFTQPQQTFYLNEIVRHAGTGVGSVQRELAALEAAGLVTRSVRGNHVYFQANPECPVYTELKALIDKTIGAAETLRRSLTPLQGAIAVAFIYGSFARGDAARESDVDVLIVGDVSMLDIAPRLGEARQRIGRAVNPTVFPTREFAERVRAGDHFVRNVTAGAKIFLLGGERELGRLVEEGRADNA